MSKNLYEMNVLLFGSVKLNADKEVRIRIGFYLNQVIASPAHLFLLREHPIPAGQLKDVIDAARIGLLVAATRFVPDYLGILAGIYLLCEKQLDRNDSVRRGGNDKVDDAREIALDVSRLSHDAAGAGVTNRDVFLAGYSFGAANKGPFIHRTGGQKQQPGYE
jgi:hypothetical protein